MVSRREVIVRGAAVASGLALLRAQASRGDLPRAEPPQTGIVAETGTPTGEHTAAAPGEPGQDYAPVIVPDSSTLTWRVVNGVKVYHLVAEPLHREFAPGFVVECWGYNGQTPGPLIEAVEGDRVRIYVTNRLPEPTSVHWHGVILPNGMDGVSGLNQRAIPPGKTYKYEFTLRQAGTFMYHPHFDEMTQMGMGMQGMFVMHPRSGAPRVDRDFAIMLSEWTIKPGTNKSDTTEPSDFNVLTFNSKVFPATSPLVAKRGDRVRIRLWNLSAMDHHPIHLHGYQFRIAATDGGRIPEAGQWPETTVLVPVGSTRDIEFVADQPGDWALHCHMTHHTMNQMGHRVPIMLGVKTDDLDAKVRQLLPEYMTMGNTGMGDMAAMGMAAPKNSIPMVGGKGPFGTIDMGGMFTVFKVRDGITSYDDPGWYDHPHGTVAEPARPDELRADGIKV